MSKTPGKAFWQSVVGGNKASAQLNTAGDWDTKKPLTSSAVPSRETLHNPFQPYDSSGDLPSKALSISTSPASKFAQPAMDSEMERRLLIIEQLLREEKELKTEKKEPITLKDAVGRKYTFPFQRCQRWEGIEELIKQAFLHVDVVGPHVIDGHYDLIGPNGEIILPQVWETFIEPGMAIRMQMWPIPDVKIPRPYTPVPPGVDSIHERWTTGGPPRPPLRTAVDDDRIRRGRVAQGQNIPASKPKNMPVSEILMQSPSLSGPKSSGKAKAVLQRKIVEDTKPPVIVPTRGSEIDSSDDSSGSSVIYLPYSSELQRVKQLDKWALSPGDWSGKGKHVTIRDVKGKFRDPQVLGHGSDSLVESVYFKSMWMARKHLKINRRKVFENVREQARFMEKLVHKHIIRIVGSYSQGQRSFFLLLYPVATCDLQAFLTDIDDLRFDSGGSETDEIYDRLYALGFTRPSNSALNQALDYLPSILGCITEAVKYLHLNNVKYRYLNPRKILLSPGKVYLANFGVSSRFSYEGRSSTEGVIGDRSQYIAPEVIDTSEHHTVLADTYSLGCVFLDIASILYGIPRIHCEASLGERNLMDKASKISKLLVDMRRYADEYGLVESDNVPSSPRHIIGLLESMLSLQRLNRPTSLEVSEALYDLGGVQQIYHGTCCKHLLQDLGFETKISLMTSTSGAGGDIMITPKESKLPDARRLSIHSTDSLEYPESVISEASDFSDVEPAFSMSSTGPNQETEVDYLVTTLGENETLAALYEEGLMKIGLRRFAQNHNRLLRKYISDLKSHAETVEQREIVRMFYGRGKRVRMTEQICEKALLPLPEGSDHSSTSSAARSINAKFILNNNTASQAGESLPATLPVIDIDTERSENLDEENEDVANIRQDGAPFVLHIDRVEEFLMQGPPFAAYKTNLHRFIYYDINPQILPLLMANGDTVVVEQVLERHFDLVATGEFEWLQELDEMGISHQDMTDLLFDEFNKSPWIFSGHESPDGSEIDDIEVIEFPALLHQNGCVHQGGSDIELHLDSPDDESDHSIQNMVEQCGLAGVFPISRVTDEWVGHVEFTGASTVEVTYSMHSTKTDRYHRLCGQIERVLRTFCKVARQLQMQGLCCDSYTLLKMAQHEGEEVIELTTIKFRAGEILLEQVEQLTLDLVSKFWRQRCIQAAKHIISRVGWDEDYNTKNLNLDNVLYICSLAAQILTTSLYLYANAHTGAFHPSFLRNPTTEIMLNGCDEGPQLCFIKVELKSFTCLHDMVGDKVMVFDFNFHLRKPNKDARYDLLASPEDIVDTWGGSRFVIDSASPYGDKIYSVEVQGGFIRPVSSTESKDSASNIRKFHWTPGATMFGDQKDTFHPRTKILIGTIELNDKCPVDREQSWLEVISSGLVENLGPKAAFWEENERQLGLQMGQYGVVQFSSTRKKRPNRTLKQHHLDQPPEKLSFPFLESTWGLQVSFCTGVARRVPLRELLAEVMPAFVDAVGPVDIGWKRLTDDHDIIRAFKEPGLKTWLNGLDPELQILVCRLVHYILDALKDTGIDHSGEQFVIAWGTAENPFLCLKIPCRKASFWAKILADSEDCATFACVTSQCLETEDHKCRGLATPPWHNAASLLDTAVCRHLSNNKGGPVVTSRVWNLQNEGLYWIGKPDLNLKAKVVVTASQQPRLYVSESRIPEGILSRLGKLTKTTVERIRERQVVGVKAEQVVILAGM